MASTGNKAIRVNASNHLTTMRFILEGMLVDSGAFSVTEFNELENILARVYDMEEKLSE